MVLYILERTVKIRRAIDALDSKQSWQSQNNFVFVQINNILIIFVLKNKL